MTGVKPEMLHLKLKCFFTTWQLNILEQMLKDLQSILLKCDAVDLVSVWRGLRLFFLFSDFIFSLDFQFLQNLEEYDTGPFCFR